MKQNKRNIKNYIIPIVLSILILGVLGVYAGVTLSNNPNSYLSADNITINNSGAYLKNGANLNGVSSGTADVVVCRGTSIWDDYYKSIKWMSGCDVVCPSTSVDCANYLQNCNSKYCFIKSGQYPIQGNNIYYNYTILRGEGSNTILNYTNNHNTQYVAIDAYNGLVMENLQIDSNASDTVNSKWIILRINNSYPELTLIQNNIIRNVAFNLGQPGGATSIIKFNALVNNNQYFNPVEALFIGRIDGVTFSNNHVEDSRDSTVSINACGSNHKIINNYINKTFSSGSPIEINNDGSCGTITNILVDGNTIYSNKTGYSGLIAEVGNNLQSGNNIFSNNKLYGCAGQSWCGGSDAGILIRYSGEKILNNIIINTTNFGVWVLTDSNNVNNLDLNTNTFSGVDLIANYNTSITLQTSSGKNMSNINIIGNSVLNGYRGINAVTTANIYNLNVKDNSISVSQQCFNQQGAFPLANASFISNECLNVKTYGLNMYNSTYIDNYVYLGSINITNQLCATTGVFTDRTIHNSSTQCTCTGGAWKCWGMV